MVLGNGDDEREIYTTGGSKSNLIASFWYNPCLATERSFDELIYSRKNRTHSNVSTQKRRNTFLFFLCFVPDIWYLVLSINISPPHTNSNISAIGMIGLRMSTTSLQYIYGFGSLVHDSCFLGPFHEQDFTNHKATYWGRD